jgi:Zn-dependent protease
MNLEPLSIVQFLIQYSFFLIAASVHESAHAWTAFRFGDPTAKLQNRISLNPANHIDILGTVIIPFFVFLSGIPVIGWARPTPVNPSNFNNPKRDGMFVSGAGPVSNILSVAVLAVFWHISFALIPVFGKIAGLFCIVIGTGILVNLMLAVFNMLPIHPLDGSGVLEGLLPPSWNHAYQKMRPYGFIILLVLFYLPAFSSFIVKAVLLLGSFFRIRFYSLDQIW